MLDTARCMTPYNTESDSRPRNREPGFRTLRTVPLSCLGEEQTWDFYLALFPTYLASGSSFFYPVGVMILTSKDLINDDGANYKVLKNHLP